MFADDPVPPLGPRAGDFDAMLTRAARRRRTRRVRGAAALASAGLAAALFALPSAGGSASLGVTGHGAHPSPRPGSGSPTPSTPPAEGTADPSAEPSAGSSGDPSPRPSPRPSGWPSDPGDPGDPEPRPSGPHSSGAPSPRPSATGMPSPYDPESAASYTHTAPGTAPEDCETTPGADPAASDTRNWCAVYHGPWSFTVGVEKQIAFRLCRSARAVTAGTLSRRGPSSGWFEVHVYDSEGDEAWGWVHNSRPDLPTITVDAGACAQWVIWWTPQIEPGSYDLFAPFLVREYQPLTKPGYAITVTRS